MRSVDQRGTWGGRWNVFPAIRARAGYFPASQHIEMYETSLPELIEALQNLQSNPQMAIGVVPLLFHELRHWLDHVGTVWGMHHLVTLYNAMNASEIQKEAEYWRIMEYEKQLNRDHLSEFYTTKGNEQSPHGYPNRWLYSHTCGRRYDYLGHPDGERPIVFTRYAWADGSHACRVPFSVSSLLEAGAMSFEMESEMTILTSFPSGERQIETNRIAKERLAELYNVELGVYTTAVHLVANRMGLAELDQAFPLAGALSSLCLNLPDHLFDELRILDTFSAWGELNRAAIAQRDRGYLFMLLCHRARKDLVGDATNWVDNAARRSGLPPLYKIREQAATEVINIRATAIDGPLKGHFDQVADLGIRMHNDFGVVFALGDIIKQRGKLWFPPVVCSDGDIHGLDTAAVPDFEVWCSETIRLQKGMTEFVAACGY